MTHKHYTLRRIEKAVTFIAEQVRNGDEPELDAIADAAGLSKFHFHRLYKLATGETCRETIISFRLARAAASLRDPEVTVTEAAFSVGYGSSQSFAKALKRLLDTSASSLRADGERLDAAIEALAVPRTADGAPQPELKVEIAHFKPFEALAIRTDGAYPSLNSNYEALFEAAGGPDNVAAILGRPFGDIAGLDAEATLRFDCALVLHAMDDRYADGLSVQPVDGGTYLVTRHVGAYDRLPLAIDRLCRTALAVPELRLADEPLLFHYLDDPESTAEAELRTDVYLKIDNQ
ncbi:MAG: GyrI-like domain-containing protein [Pseudomonadota bacterium]